MNAGVRTRLLMERGVDKMIVVWVVYCKAVRVF